MKLISENQERMAVSLYLQGERLYLYCFDNQNIDDLMLFWSNCLNIPLSQFTKPFIKKNTSTGKRIMQHGVLHIRYNDKRLLEKILALCSDLAAQLLDNSATRAGTQVVNEVRLSKGSL